MPCSIDHGRRARRCPRTARLKAVTWAIGMSARSASGCRVFGTAPVGRVVLEEDGGQVAARPAARPLAHQRRGRRGAAARRRRHLGPRSCSRGHLAAVAGQSQVRARPSPSGPRSGGDRHQVLVRALDERRRPRPVHVPDQDLHPRPPLRPSGSRRPPLPRRRSNRRSGTGGPGNGHSRALVSRQGATGRRAARSGPRTGATAPPARPGRTARRPACRPRRPGAPGRCCPRRRTPAPASSAASRRGRCARPGRSRSAAGRGRGEVALARAAGHQQPASRRRQSASTMPPAVLGRSAPGTAPRRRGARTTYGLIGTGRRRQRSSRMRAGRRRRRAVGRRRPAPGTARLRARAGPAADPVPDVEQRAGVVDAGGRDDGMRAIRSSSAIGSGHWWKEVKMTAFE